MKEQGSLRAQTPYFVVFGDMLACEHGCPLEYSISIPFTGMLGPTCAEPAGFVHVFFK